MKKKEKAKVYETDLYKPIQNYFIQRGYEVYGEVKNCDVTAVKGEEIIIVELKRSFNLGLLMQAVQRQKVSELVYVAVPRPSVIFFIAIYRALQVSFWQDEFVVELTLEENYFYMYVAISELGNIKIKSEEHNKKWWFSFNIHL